MLLESQKPFIYFRNSVWHNIQQSNWHLSNRGVVVTLDTWSNSRLRSDNPQIGPGTIAQDYVVHAEKAGTLHQIHNNMERLAFHVELRASNEDFADRLLESNRFCYFACYDLSTIRLRAARLYNQAIPNLMSNLAPIQSNPLSYSNGEFLFEVYYHRGKKWRTNHWSSHKAQIEEIFWVSAGPQQHVPQSSIGML
ncbi:MAG: hypothetical protein OXU36_21490 [Candidatus Poribacteria bacterium]|nr:hypothetical protein [Candidatus Poribacteria bacterium]